VVLSIGLKVMAMDPPYIYLLHVPPPDWQFIFKAQNLMLGWSLKVPAFLGGLMKSFLT
jgi:hypothetical protein